MLGASLYKLVPDKKAFPFHFHHANEEAVFILNGQGTLRLKDDEIPIQANDYAISKNLLKVRACVYCNKCLSFSNVII